MPDATYDNQNIFAKILRGELPCIKVYEDDHTIAFMDIMPQADGHVLVLPKEGAAELFDLSDDAASAAIRTTRKLARAVRAAFTPPGIAIFQLNGSAAGQTVPHVHFHVLPRYSDTRCNRTPACRPTATSSRLRPRRSSPHCKRNKRQRHGAADGTAASACAVMSPARSPVDKPAQSRCWSTASTQWQPIATSPSTCSAMRSCATRPSARTST